MTSVVPRCRHTQCGRVREAFIHSQRTASVVRMRACVRVRSRLHAKARAWRSSRRLESAIQKEVSAKRAVTSTGPSSARHTGSDRARGTNRSRWIFHSIKHWWSASNQSAGTRCRDDHLAVVVSIDRNHAGTPCGAVPLPVCHDPRGSHRMACANPAFRAFHPVFPASIISPAGKRGTESTGAAASRLGIIV